MKKEQAKVIQLCKDTIRLEGVRVGVIVKVDAAGVVFVDFAGNSFGPLVARTTTSSGSKISGKGNPDGREVLLAFESGNPQEPIIVDTMSSPAEEVADASCAVVEAGDVHELCIDGERIAVEAAEQLVLNCGKASITLTKAGKVLIKGEYVLSHSFGENRIRGGSIAIN